MYRDSNMSSKHKRFWTGLQKQPLSLKWSGGKMITLIEVLNMQDLSSKMNNYCGGLRRAKSMVTNEENGVCVGYFVSVTPGVTLQSIQCQSNCEDKTGRANQCSGSQTARSHERAPLFHGPCSAHEKLQPCLWPGLTAITVSHADEPCSGFQIKSCRLTCPCTYDQHEDDIISVDGNVLPHTHPVGAVGELLTIAFHREWFGCPCKSSSLLWD